MEGDISNAIVPDCLQTLAVKYICSNLTKTICDEIEGGDLKLKDGINLPMKIADALFQHLLISLNLEPFQEQLVSDNLVKYCRIFADGSKCKLRRVTINQAPISDDMVQVLVDLSDSHSLVEIDLTNSNDMNGNDNDFTPPYNHAILLPRFILEGCGQTLQKLNMDNANFAYSISQIMSFSGKKAKVLKQNVYLTSDATLEHLPFCVSKENAPLLMSLDISETFTGWFMTIDPENPPPLKEFNLAGYREIRINSLLKKLLLQLLHGEEDYNVPPEQRRGLIAHSKSERKLQKYRFFDRLAPVQPNLEKFVRIAKLEDHLKEDDRLAADYDVKPSYNVMLRQLHILSMKDTLQSFGLYGTYLTMNDFEDVIFKLKGLRHLDVGWPSKMLSESERFRPSDMTVWKILENLPRLQSLDVSGTRYGEKLCEESKGKELQMPLGREPLDFLGLWRTNACQLPGLENIAHKVTGDANENQLLTSLETYMNRNEYVSTIMNKLMDVQQQASSKRPNLTMKLLLKAAQTHSKGNSVLFMCAANIYYMVQFQLEAFNCYQRQDIIRTITMIIERNLQSRELVRNCLIIYFLFQLPGDLLFDFDHIGKLVLNIFDKQRDEHEINIISGNLCNALVCSTEFDTKQDMCKHNYIGIMVDIIKGRLAREIADDVLETAWSALWNITDETSANTDQFIELGGLKLFKECYELFSKRTDLVRNMMGLMGNLSEVKHARPQLADKELLNIFVKLVNADAGSTVEIAYNACGLLSNLLADDIKIFEGMDLDDIRKEMKAAILSWDIDVARNINYHTFAPLFTLLKSPREPITHLWCTWAIHNLCNREWKYVKLVIQGGGVGVIKAVRDSAEDQNTWYFADQIAKKCDQDTGSAV